jgi:hypothetical protein
MRSMEGTSYFAGTVSDALKMFIKSTTGVNHIKLLLSVTEAAAE